MKPEILSTAIETLSDLFFRKKTTTDFLAMRTLEYFVSDLDLLGDVNAVAAEVERQGAWALVPKFKLFDNKSADEIEAVLHWGGYTEAEIIASEKVFEDWKRKQL
ncbi:hypothetical protein ABH916_003447 [Peribacillus frigoritolerans]|uniref:hypothetical protein n=1 Tax=Peribacillus frigoritolerans TaxID=450367 RepID=UPI0038346A53